MSLLLFSSFFLAWIAAFIFATYYFIPKSVENFTEWKKTGKYQMLSAMIANAFLASYLLFGDFLFLRKFLNEVLCVF